MTSPFLKVTDVPAMAFAVALSIVPTDAKACPPWPTASRHGCGQAELQGEVDGLRDEVDRLRREMEDSKLTPEQREKVKAYRAWFSLRPAEKQLVRKGVTEIWTRDAKAECLRMRAMANFSECVISSVRANQQSSYMFWGLERVGGAHLSEREIAKGDWTELQARCAGLKGKEEEACFERGLQ